MTGPKKVDAIYAWIATEPDGGEGICAMEIVLDERPMFTPLIGCDMDRVESLREMAVQIREKSGCPVRLVRFAGPLETLEVLA